MSVREDLVHRILRGSAIVIALSGAILVFIQYFFPTWPLATWAQPLLQWVILLTAAAILFATAHLFVRYVRQVPEKPVSVLVLVAFTVTFGAGLLPELVEVNTWLYRWLLAPGLAALFALLPIFLIYAIYTRLHLRDLGALLFAGSLLLVLIGQTPLLAAEVPFLAAIRHDILIGPTAAVFRGVLIGLALSIILSVMSRLRIKT